MGCLAMLLLVLLIMVSGFIQEDDFLSCYECGFDSVVKARSVFSFRFFILAMLFIVFDVEISLMLPLLYVSLGVGVMVLFGIFIVVLLLGVLYEIMLGSMEWL